MIINLDVSHLRNGTNLTVIRVASPVYMPFVNPCFTSPNCSDVGSEAGMLLYMLLSLGFDAEFIETDNNNEMMEMLKNDSADIAGYTTDCYDALNLTTVSCLPTLFFELPVFVLRPRPSGNLKFNLLFSVSDYKLWIGFIICFVIIWLSKIFLMKSFLVKDKRAMDIGATVSFFMLGVALGVYSNFLSISLNSLEKIMPSIVSLRHLSQLLLYGQCRLVVERRAILNENLIYNIINPVDNERMYDVQARTNLIQAYRKNPPLTRETPSEVLQTIQTSPNKCLIGALFNSIIPFYQKDLCHLEDVLLSEIPSRSFSFQYRAEGGFGEVLYKYLRRGDATQHYREFIQHYVRVSPKFRTTRCISKTNPNLRRPLTFGQLLDLAELTASLWAAAVFVLVTEKLWKIRQRLRNWVAELAWDFLMNSSWFFVSKKL